MFVVLTGHVRRARTGARYADTCTHVYEIKNIALECVLVPHAVCACVCRWGSGG